MLKQSFWSGNSDLQEVADLLAERIPQCGPVENPRKNRALERFRRASNCYYDLFNNGLCNRGQEFSRLFKIRVRDYRVGRWDMDFDAIAPVVEPVMRQFVLDAAKEQWIAV